MLTDTKLRKSLGRERDAEEIISDKNGLNVKISPKGTISFFYRYRWNGKAVKLTIGNYPAMTLSQAREQRQQMRNWLDDGTDPRERLKLRLAERTDALSVSEAFNYWIEKYCIANQIVKASYNLQVFKKHIEPSLGTAKLDNTTREHWINLFDGMESRVMAHHMVSLCSRAFKFCRNRGVVKSNPLADILPGDVGQKPKIKERKLTFSELKVICDWLTIHQTEEAKFLIKFLMLTGCRTAEIRQATWDWFDFENNTWTIPATHFKTRVSVRRALSPLAVKMLMDRKKSVSTRHVLTSPRVCVGKDMDRPVMPQVAANYAKTIREGAGMSLWSLHDLRRTFATSVSELGCPPHVVEKLLGHQMMGVMAHYNLHDYIDDQRHWVGVWEQKLTEVIGGNLS